MVSAGKTLDTHLRDALANLRAVQGHTLGVVLNRVAKGSHAGYYGGGGRGRPPPTKASPKTVRPVNSGKHGSIPTLL